MQQAAAYFNEAIAKDGNYAAAYSGLANTYALLVMEFAVSSSKVAMPCAISAAQKALNLDSSLGEAHASLERYNYDFQTADAEFRRAGELSPGYATGIISMPST